MKRVYTVFLILCFQNTFSQSFIHQIHSTTDNIIEDFYIDENKNIFITGFFNVQVDFDLSNQEHILTSNGNYDIFIAKYDSIGNFIFARSFGSSGSDYGRKISMDKSGNIYIAGTISNTVGFDQGNTGFSINSNNGNVFILKLDNEGNFLWARAIKSDSQIPLADMKTDEDGNIYMAGGIYKNSDLDPGILAWDTLNIAFSENSDHAYIIKIDSNGSLVFYHILESLSFFSKITINQIDIDNQGNVYAIGGFSKSCSFGSAHNSLILSSNSNAIFILKLNYLGEFKWAKAIRSEGYIESHSLFIDKQTGDFFISGLFSSTIYETHPNNPYLTAENWGSKLFFEKRDSWGNLYYADYFSTASYDENIIISGYSDEKIYMTGQFKNPIKLNSKFSNQTYYATNNFDAFMTVIDLINYNTIFYQFSGQHIENVKGLSADTENNLYFCGVFRQDMQLSPWEAPINFTSSLNNSFFGKIEATKVHISDHLSSDININVYPNPAVFEINISSNELIVEINIYDIKGVFIQKHQLYDMHYKIPLDGLLQGMYLLEIKTKNQVYFSKFVKM